MFPFSRLRLLSKIGNKMSTRSLFTVLLIFNLISFLSIVKGQSFAFSKDSRKYDTDQKPSLYFTKEPPNQIDFSNNTGAKIECIAGGRTKSSKQIGWSLLDGTKLTDIRGLRRVQKDGTLIFDPINSEAFRQDVHTATYQCRATADDLTIVSTDVKIRAVMDVDYDSNVYDVFAIRGNTAVIKCHVPTFLQEFVSVVAFIKDDNLKISTSSNIDAKYYVASHGVLYVHNVTQSDTGSSFRCQTLHRLTGQLRISSTQGKLFVTEPHGNIPSKIIDSLTMVNSEVGHDVLLPCVPHSHPTPNARWSIKSGGYLLELNSQDKKYKIIFDGMTIKNVQLVDSGVYVCQLNSTSGSDQAETTLNVEAPLSAKVDKPIQIIDLGKSAVIRCYVTGSPIKSVSWTKNGHLFDTSRQMENLQIVINAVTLEDKGIYQCFARNDLYSAQATAEIKIGTFPPIFKAVFNETVTRTGASATMSCSVLGNPTPKIRWILDSLTVSADNYRVFISETSTPNSASSTLHFKVVTESDGGVYSCIAENDAGKQTYSRRLNIYGSLKARKVPTQKVVAGLRAELTCPIYGYPIDHIQWYRGAILLPMDIRQDLFGNWSLLISDVNKVHDSGTYSCTASNKKTGQNATAEINLSVLVLPKIAPFAFQEDLVREGMRAQIQCVISEGDTPLTIQWKKDDQSLNNAYQDITINQVDEYSSNLAIRYVAPKHNGNYTCVASNSAGSTTHTAILSVNARPKVIPFAFQDDQNFMSMRAHITCTVSQGDLPLTFQWLKDGLPIDQHPSISGDIQFAKYDQYSGFLSIQSVTSQHSGNYTCVASNGAGKDSYTARLIVQVAPKIVPFNFQGEHLFEGVLARVSCVVYQGDLPLRIQWDKDGHIIENGQLRGINVRTVDDFTSILTIDHVTVEHSGTYRCMAKNSVASAFHMANLIVNVPPKIVPFTFPEDELAEGTFVRVACVVGRGDLPLNFTWTKDEGHASLGDGVAIRRIDDYSSVLSIDRVSVNHTGMYTCRATNAAATTAHSSYLRVFVPPKWVKVPEATITVLSGSTVSLDCEAEGHPQPIINWLIKQGSGSNIVMKALEDNSNGRRIYSNGTLRILDVTEQHEDAYFCKATNGIGQGLSWKVQLEVQIPVNVIEHSDIQSVKVGQKVTLYCLIRGHQPITSSWTVDNKNLSINEKSRYATKMESNATHVLMQLTIPKAASSDAHQYGCHVKDIYGYDNATIKVVVEGPPDAPTKINATNKGNKSIEVFWQAPFDGHSPILRYIISYQLKKGSSSEKVATNDGHTTSIILRNLQPSSTYKITVMAENGIGHSDDNEHFSVTLDGEAPSAAPSNIIVLPQNGRSLRVSWQPPPSNTWNGAILGYNVGYRIDDQPYTFRLLEVPEGYDKGLSFTLSDLKEFTSYGVVVQAFNVYGKGPLSEEVLAMTSERVPSRPPMTVDCSLTSAVSLTIRWEPPPQAFHHGIIRGYRILYWTPTNSWNGDSGLQVVNTSETVYELRDLLPNANYSVQVLAYTLAGDGTASKSIYCQTLEDIPSAPKDIKVLPLNTDSVMVLWTAPKTANGRITHYTVYYEDVAASKENRIVVKGHEIMKQKVGNLRAGQKYNFRVSATTVVGEGPTSQHISMSPTSRPTKVRISAFGGLVIARVDHLLVLQCPIVGGGLNPKIQWIHNEIPVSSGQNNRTLIQSDGSLRLPSVKITDTGNYTCMASNNQGQDKITYNLIVKVHPSTPMLTVIGTTDTTVTVQLKINTDISMTPILSYDLHYKRDFEAWIVISLQPYLNKFTVETLHCGSTYQFYMIARNNVGNSPASHTISATTAGGVPLVPPLEQLVEASHVYASVNLSSWIPNACPILYFALEYKSKISPSWILVSNDLSPNKKSIRLNELQPSTWYSLRMTAHTSAGSSMAEYDFSTMDITEDAMSDDDGHFGASDFFSFADFNVIISVSSCSVLILLCLSITCFWVKRKNIARDKKKKKSSKTKPQKPRKNLQKHKAIKTTGSDDDISPYAMVKLSDIHPHQPKPSDHRVAPMCNGGTPLRHSSMHNYNPTAPPMSESYFPRGGEQSRKYPLLPTNPMYAMPHKEKVRHVRSSSDKISHMPLPPPPLPNQQPPLPDIATIFEFPPPPEVAQDGDYDPPPPEISWLETKR